jgi:murein DD-endopeptidase MepM/ murein hydrolase activator NlpD
VNVRKWFARKPDRFLTIKVISDTSATTRDYVVSFQTVKRLKIAAVVTGIVLIVGIVAIVNSVYSHREIASLSSENQILERRTQAMSELRVELARIWIINERLQRMLGGGSSEQVSQPATRAIPWGPPLARWAGIPFVVNPTERPELGVRIQASPGTLVLATASGKVNDIRWSPEDGDVIYINHGEGVLSAYGRDLTSFVRPGEYVSQGQTIGVINDTRGARQPTMFYKVIVDGSPVNPLISMTGLSAEVPVYPLASAR